MTKKVLRNNKVFANIPNYVLPPKLTFAQLEMFTMINISMVEIKQANSNAKVASQQFLVITTISVDPTS